MDRKEINTNRVDMLNGGLFVKILLFALPLAASSILQQLFNAVDVAVVGHFASPNAQAAVGCNGPIINLLLNLFIGISVGANVVIANYIGRKETDKISAAVHTAMSVAIVGGILLIFVGIGITKPILTLMNTPPEVINLAALYLKIYFLGMPFILVYNFGAAILRSIGDTKRPLICLIIAGIVNTCLNLFLVIVFHLDVEGVAIATVVSNIISSAMVWYFLSKEEEPLRLSLKKLGFSKPELRKMLVIGVPAGLQSMVFSLSNIFVQSTLNGYGAMAVAGSAVAVNYESTTYFIINAFTQANVTFTGQNYGAEKYDRCKKIFLQSMLTAIALMALASNSIVIFKDFFIGLFTPDSEVAAMAAQRMAIILPFNFLMAPYENAGASLRGIGYSMTPAVITILGTCVFRILWIFTICRCFPKIEVLFAIYPVSWFITTVAMVVTYLIIRKRAFSSDVQNIR